MNNLTQQQRMTIISNLKKGFTEQIKHIIEYICIAEEIGITNESFFIEYEDWLNRLSVLDHTIGISKDMINEVNLNKVSLLEF